MISAIVAMANNNVIGKSNDLPWYLPADLAYFKEKTSGGTVIMGRKTFDSILDRIHKPLPGRKNIVISRNHDYKPEGVDVVDSVEDAIKLADSDEVFILGGEQIYKLAMPLLDRIYLTEVKADIDGDAFFPNIPGDFHEVSRESHKKDEKNQYDYDFVCLDKTAHV